jgi:hypothetical protein
MRQFMALLAGAMLAVAAAQAQTSVRVRGAITAIDGNILSVASRDGRDLKITLADNVAVSVAKAVRFADIKQGDYVGATTMPGPNGMPVAIEVHYLPPSVPPGQLPWDLQAGSTMTNANVASMVSGTSGHELTLRFNSATQTIAVPEGVPIVRAVPGGRTDLVVGEYVFLGAQAASEGSLSAARVQVSKDGVKPPL